LTIAKEIECSEPRSLRKVIEGQQWLVSMKKEIESLKKNHKRSLLKNKKSGIMQVCAQEERMDTNFSRRTTQF